MTGRRSSSSPTSATFDDANVAAEHDAEGVGLFRPSSSSWTQGAFLSEDEQFAAYQKVALRMKDQPVIIRTLDVGGDKEIPASPPHQGRQPPSWVTARSATA